MALIATLGVIISVAALPAGGNLLAQGRLNTASAPAKDFEVLQIRRDFYMIAGAGGNIAVQVGSDASCWSIQAVLGYPETLYPE